MDLSAFDLKGKVALITGGAHGIGFSIAEGMAKCGATVCFNCSNQGSLEKGLAAYKAAGVDAHGYVADVTDEAAVNAMIAQIKADVSIKNYYEKYHNVRVSDQIAKRIDRKSVV